MLIITYKIARNALIAAILFYCFLLVFFKPFAHQATRYIYKHIEYPSLIVTERYKVSVPDRWYVERVDNDGSVLLSNVPRITEQGFLMILLSNTNPVDVCERVVSHKWQGETCSYTNDGPLFYRRESGSNDENRIDMLWIFPSKGVMAIAVDFDADTKGQFESVVKSVYF